MNSVKSFAGLVVVLGVFGVGLLIGLAMFVFGVATVFTGSLGPITPLALALGMIGIYMAGGVLYLFARNFSWKELTAPDVITSRDKAPIAIEVRYDDEKSRRYLVDSRHSPRSANPRKLGRGIFLMTRKRGVFQQESDVITLMDSTSSKVKDVRDFEDKIHFTLKETDKTHTVTISALSEHAVNFERKDSWDLLETTHDSRQKVAEAWAKALKSKVKS